MMDVKPFLTDQRKDRLRSVVKKRQFDLTVVIENVHNPHNISAVIRSCDAIGISEIYAVVTDERINLEKYDVHYKIASGSEKWVEIKVFTNLKSCITALRKRYKNIIGTHLSKEAVSLYSIDFSDSTALVFGNEHDGLSEEFLHELDGNFHIPQFGMVQSLNISVACAVSVFEAARQKIALGHYKGNEWTNDHEELYEKYTTKSKPRLLEDTINQDIL